MTSYRSLNGISGIGGGSSANSLIKTNNLSDLTNVPAARTNLGLVGSLTVATPEGWPTNPYISITNPYDGTSNQQISLSVSTTGTYDTLVAYNNIGDVTLQNFATLYTGYVWTSGINYTNRIRKTAVNVPFSIFDDSGNVLLRFQQTTNKCYIPGNVGIGTTDPMYPLHVTGEAFIGSNIHLNSIYSSGTEKFKFISNTLTTLSSGLIIGEVDPDVITGWSFGGGDTRLWCEHLAYIKNLSTNDILASEKVTTPSIVESTNYVGITLRDGFDAFDLAKIGYRPNNAIGNYDIYSYFAGSVGIGTYSPSRQLHVEGNSYVTGNFTVDDYARCDKLITNTISSTEPVISFDSKSIDMVHDVTVYNILYADTIQSKTPSTIINMGDISLTTLTVDAITSTGTYISLSDKDVGNIDNLTVNLNQVTGNVTYCDNFNVIANQDTQTDYTYSFNFNNNHFASVGDITCRGLNTDNIVKGTSGNLSFKAEDNATILATLTDSGVFNVENTISTPLIKTNTITTLSGSTISLSNNNLTNIANVTKQLWSYAVSSTTSSISFTAYDGALPTAGQSLMTNTCSSTNYAVRVTVPLYYQNETTVRFNYYIVGVSTGTVNVLMRLNNPDGTYISSTNALYTTSTPSNTLNSLSLSLSGLTAGTTYTVTIFDLSSIANATYTLRNPEISLLY